MPSPTPKSATLPKVRRIAFPFGKPKPMNKHFMKGNIPFSHLLALLSYSFPPGEEFFIRAVRRFSGEITDPVLKKRAAGFVGQEAMHSQQHSVLNEKLLELGYSKTVYNITMIGGRALERVERFTDEHAIPGIKWFHLGLLAATAAGEHFTSVAAERILGHDDVQEILSDPEVRNLMNWHAFEEMEHKSVAFDVYKAAGGPEWLRIAALRFWAATMYPLITLAVLFSIIMSDTAALLHPARLVRETADVYRSALVKDILGKFKPFYKRGFHPDDIDTNELLEKWSAQLFGEQGALVGHLK
ncbi:metal-dependent hydrolase [Segniliparus rugosus]|uniref:Metal-dependent hydrolase n=1 Tax=Segniliparus rugosus (strain ATCC BAA-974 / DSM 45345 / CCUG 50838 / CIP 108380 / JCM 13579 / CDC 945) TaxID=679197 RepID=E5XP02_SEGRC|nr:metal-dependent hydrolase [Segniliparus rugosus]EFV13894.1 hypothetical protein HMPREF9336_01223 [Segniliparus rugosus ATCC BAA-974]